MPKINVTTNNHPRKFQVLILHTISFGQTDIFLLILLLKNASNKYRAQFVYGKTGVSSVKKNVNTM